MHVHVECRFTVESWFRIKLSSRGQAIFPDHASRESRYEQPCSEKQSMSTHTVSVPVFEVPRTALGSPSPFKRKGVAKACFSVNRHKNTNYLMQCGVSPFKTMVPVVMNPLPNMVPLSPVYNESVESYITRYLHPLPPYTIVVCLSNTLNNSRGVSLCPLSSRVPIGLAPKLARADAALLPIVMNSVLGEIVDGAIWLVVCLGNSWMGASGAVPQANYLRGHHLLIFSRPILKS